MLGTSDLALFAVASLICIVMPGPAVLYVLANGLGRGSRASLAAACGTTAGVSVHLAAVIAGLAAVLHTSALLFTAVKLVGAAYLIFLAWRTLRAREAFEMAPGVPAAPQGRIFWTGFGVNILNPKLSIFFLAFLPQFVGPAAARPAVTMLLLGAIFMVMTLGIFILYGLFAARIRSFLRTRPLIGDAFRWSFAGLFFALGVRLALTQRT